ncbi:hypothetical protein [Streptomyces sp. NPDC006285]|uniref:hypothetical protein n=1 Tax=Streptomyces sp. NPDC006285 TaxID=3364742 RepID=UPI00368B6FF8
MDGCRTVHRIPPPGGAHVPHTAPAFRTARPGGRGERRDRVRPLHPEPGGGHVRRRPYANPWLNLLLPGRAAADLAGRLLDALTQADLGPGGVVLLYPLVRARVRAPLLRMPDDPVPYLLAVLRTAPPGDAATVRRLLAANRSAYDLVRAAGGTRYPVGSVPFDEADRRRHLGPARRRLAAAKKTYDPRGILAPGQGIFRRPERRTGGRRTRRPLG